MNASAFIRVAGSVSAERLRRRDLGVGLLARSRRRDR
jgi:hypothetical protein